ncbi:Membrane-associated lipoprotein precursor [Mycoplasmopsis maculosa]|uniref:Membrane-associated lipoprotein n=1 Tax=Mycoplasmopsis maculosa TaxID=114885 RepID=A0A449B3R8_9BACT|nr:DUF31 family protein [Mycoplasmopsis maculosa]VEU75237.1 Membrane-associated lipoprotein precursor [Mycoplasmopsis maculosa]
MKKKFLVTLPLSSLTFFSFISASCNSDLVDKDQKNNKEKKLSDKTNPSKPEKGKNETLNPGAGSSSISSDKYSTKQAADFIKGKRWDQVFNFGHNFEGTWNSKTTKQFEETYGDFPIEPVDSKLDIKVLYANAISNTEVEFTVDINGNRKIYTLNGFKVESNPIIPIFSDQGSEPNDIDKYIDKSDADKWRHDFDKVKNVFERFRSNNEYVSNLSDEEIIEYNRKAEKLGLPSYQEALLLGQALPKNKSDNSKELIHPNIPNPQISNWYDNFGLSESERHKNHGLARTITNETYAQAGLHSYSITFNNAFVPNDRDEDKKVLEEVFKYEEEFSDMISHLKDVTIKNKFTSNWEKIKPENGFIRDLGNIQIFINKLVTQLIRDKYVENGGNLSDLSEYQDGKGHIRLYVTDQNNSEKTSLFRRVDDDIVWGTIWKPHLIKFQNKMIEKLKATSLSSEIKTKMTEAIKEANELWRLKDNLRSSSSNSGTAFIIDYEKPKDGGQPKKFYFATNLHVTDGIIPNSFSGFGMTRLNYKSIGKKLQTTTIDTVNFSHFSFKPNIFKVVWSGRDYLKQDPKDWLNNPAIKEKEFIDIAIFELDFNKLTKDDYSFYENLDDYIKTITNNYYNSDNKIGFINYDYLNNYNKINFSKVESNLDNYDMLYALGYPLTDSLKTHNFFDYYLDQYEDERDYSASKYTYSIWTNAKHSWYKFAYDANDEELIKNLNKGSGLGYNLNYRTFKNKHGIIDSFISSPKFGKDLYKSNDGQKYYNASLAYNIDRYTPGGGASGSSVRTQNNKIVGLFHVSNYFAHAGLTEAIRSEGFNYEGLFGNYNLPQYDVIYGGGKDQKTSYREELQKLYGNDFKTALFENINEIPSEFIFKK